MKKIISLLLIFVFIPTYVFPFDSCITAVEGLKIGERNEYYLKFSYLNLDYTGNYEDGIIVFVVEKDNSFLCEIVISESGISIYPNQATDTLCILLAGLGLLGSVTCYLVDPGYPDFGMLFLCLLGRIFLGLAGVCLLFS
jgi:hypothetical protein